MPWPMSQDYNEAIQTPSACFDDPELQARAARSAMPWDCRSRAPAISPTSTPCNRRGRSGPSSASPVRFPASARRYAEISKYLAASQLPFMVEFKFLDQGIRIRGQWYPGAEDALGRRLHAQSLRQAAARQPGNARHAVPDVGEDGRPLARRPAGPLRPAARQRHAGAGQQGRQPVAAAGRLRRHVRPGSGAARTPSKSAIPTSSIRNGSASASTASRWIASRTW